MSWDSSDTLRRAFGEQGKPYFKVQSLFATIILRLTLSIPLVALSRLVIRSEQAMRLNEPFGHQLVTQSRWKPFCGIQGYQPVAGIVNALNTASLHNVMVNIIYKINHNYITKLTPVPSAAMSIRGLWTASACWPMHCD